MAMKTNAGNRVCFEDLFPVKELYINLFENASEAHLILNETEIIDCNKAAVSALKYGSKNEIVGFDLVHISNGFSKTCKTEKIQEYLSYQVNPDNARKLFWRFSCADDSEFETQVKKNLITLNGQTFSQLSFSPNIPQHNSTDSESKYQKIFENVQDVFYRTDLQGTIIEISPSIKRYSNYIHHDVIGKSIWQFYRNSEQRDQLLKEIQEKGEVFDFEVTLLAQNGQAVYASVNAHYFFDEHGKVAGVEGTIRDLTERKQSEEKLKLSLSLLRATLDSTNDGILVVSLEGKITSYNKQFKLMFNHLDEILEAGDDDAAINYVLDQLKEPKQFVAQIKHLYDHPELESYDVIELKNNRTMERFSCPQMFDGVPIGRVWSFREITRRKKAEDQLHLMASTIKSINESISITDTNNRILFVNAAFLKTYGYTEDELIGQDIAMVRSPNNDPDEVNSILNLTNENGWQGELLNRKKDGTDFPISLSTTIIKNDKGEILGMVGVAVDITDRKRAEEALMAKEAHLTTLVQTIPDLIWLKDINGVYLTCNKMFESFFGATASEIIGKTDYDFVEKDLADFFRKNDQKAVSAGKPTSNEEWITFASDGHRAMLETIKTPMYDPKGNIIGVLGIGRNITDRKQVEEQLRESEEKYRNLIDSMPDGVYRSTPEGKFVEVNPAMVKMLGYSSKEELMAINIKSELYFDPADRESLVLETTPEELDVYPLKKKDGSAVWVEDHGWYVRNEKNEIIYHEGVSRDVTDRKMAELQMQKYSEELQELNATKDKFFSIIAHDMKTPFNSILGLSELIKDEAKYMDIATIEQYAGIIYSTSSSTFRLLENLLDWARVQQSRMPFNPVAVILKKAINEVTELMVEKANSKMIAIINYVSENTIVLADQDMLKTILRNLISNALKYTQHRGKIEIIAQTTLTEVKISVKDNGVGISKEDIGKLFKIGSNFTKRGTENEKGTGLGLTLCKEFVEKHGGKISVESEKDRGSTFSFTLKLIE